MLNKDFKTILRVIITCMLLIVIAASCNRNKSENSDRDMSNMDMKGMDMKDMKRMDMKSMGIPDPKDMDGNEKLNFALKPTNEYVRTSTDLTALSKSEEAIEVEALGNIAYDTRQVGTISAWISGRIEKLYVRYRYQKVTAGQKIMDIYSPEILTAEQNLLFLIKNDPSNKVMIDSAKDKLLLLGMNREQLDQVIRNGEPAFTISVYSRYSGHIHEAGQMNNSMTSPQPEGMRDISLLTEELPLKEGMYVDKGQSVFSVYNPNRAWVLLNFYADKQNLIQKGNYVTIVPETAPSKRFSAKIDFIEPFFRKDSKTVSARVYFDNSKLQIPIGSQVRAIIYGRAVDANWLPETAVLSLGISKVAFIKQGEGFKAHIVTTGVIYKDKVQVLSGLSPKDSVVANAQYLMDSEGFIKVKE